MLSLIALIFKNSAKFCFGAFYFKISGKPLHLCLCFFVFKFNIIGLYSKLININGTLQSKRFLFSSEDKVLTFLVSMALTWQLFLLGKMGVGDFEKEVFSYLNSYGSNLLDNHYLLSYVQTL